MIRHNPYGLGHHYITSNDQRIPVLPELGKTLELRVHATDDHARISVEWDDGAEKSILELQKRTAPKDILTISSDGTTHLSKLVCANSGAFSREAASVSLPFG